MSIPEDSLLDLLIQLKKISSTDVRAILNPQPQIAYSLFELMVQLDLVDIDALNKTLTTQQPPGPAPAAPIQSSPPLLAPAPIAPAQDVGHLLLQSREPSLSDPTNHTHTLQTPVIPPQDSQGRMVPSSFPLGISQGLLNSIPEDQKAMLLHVISMTPAQIEQLPPAERATFTQLRQAVGLSS